MKYVTRAKPMHAKAEINSGKELVEKHGYVPLKTRIEDMMAAGQRLADYRAGRYDYGLEDDPDAVDYDPDPTRNPGYDMADATRDVIEAGARIAAAQKAKKEASRQAKKDSGAPADDAAGSESEGTMS